MGPNMEKTLSKAIYEKRLKTKQTVYILNEHLSLDGIHNKGMIIDFDCTSREVDYIPYAIVKLAIGGKAAYQIKDIFVTNEECVKENNKRNADKQIGYEDKMCDKEDVLRFALNHNLCEDIPAKEAFINRAYDLFGIDLNL